ncbi:MAG: GNAT family N-acetyltransferase [Lachnospiraceae bacterium]|nr:GNAT family N-acetyltransferase [Lachnospiraceae bacterium]
MKTPILETERLILRPLSLADADNIFERWTSDDRVSKYVRWSTHNSVKDTMEWLKLEEANLHSDKVYQWGFTIKEDGYLFGSGGICFNEDECVFELGYNIMHKYWNQGYTTEAAKAILDFAVNELKQKEFIAWHAVDNPASGAVMKKCGFVYEKNEIHTKFDGVTCYDTKKYRLIIQ